MSKKITYLFLIISYILTLDIYSQSNKTKQNKDDESIVDEFTVFKAQAKSNYKIGSYIKALVRFNICVGIDRERGKELAQLIENSQKLYPLQEKALKLFLNKDFNASKLIYEQIIQINPDDNVAKRKVEDIRAIINTPPNNDLDKFMDKGDDFLAKGELEKAKRYY